MDKKRSTPDDRLPVDLPSAMSGYEKESQEAEAKLADKQNAEKKKSARKGRDVNQSVPGSREKQPKTV
jgi:hypothetical protein